LLAAQLDARVAALLGHAEFAAMLHDLHHGKSDIGSAGAKLLAQVLQQA
jgi:hypothetical protein